VDEAGLLHAAGMLAVARRAGAAPRRLPVPEGMTLKDQILVPPAAAARLAALLGGVRAAGDQRDMRRLLHEWLELAAEREVVPPPHLIPALLDIADQDDTLRPLVRAVGGERAAWLAGLQPRAWGWSAAPAELTEDDWHDGDAGTRVAYLADLRRRDPAAGRDLLAQAWPTERAAELARLIGACRQGLDMADEPWLEHALGDRRAQVRAAAATLLQRLPGSAYGDRMAGRVTAWCRASGRGALVLELPEACDAAMQRDGIEQKANYGLGERAWWLEQVIAAAPLGCWAAIDPDPGSLLRRRVNDDLGALLRRALTSATLAQRDARWASALCRRGALDDYDVRPLLELLPPAEAVAVTAGALAESSPHANAYLAALPQPWPAEICSAVLAKLGSPQFTQSTGWRSLVTHAESGLPPACAGSVRELAGDLPFGEVLRQLAAFLHIRFEIHREFAS
jgi:hypothetical protein